MRFLKEYVITDEAAYVTLLEKLEDVEYITVDCETEEFSEENFLPWQLELNGVGVFANDDVYGFIIGSLVDDRLNQLFLNKRLVFHNAKFDLQVFEARGFDVDNYKIDDTLIMSWLADENRLTHKLKDLARDILKVSTGKIVKFKDLKKKPVKDNGTLFDEMFYQRDYDAWLDETARYCMKDCWYTWKLHAHYLPILEADGLMETYTSLELPFIGVLRRMERRGIKVDVDYLKELGYKLDAELRKVEEEINIAVGHDINPNSPVQLKQLFFDTLKYDLPDDLKSKDGKLTTDVKALDYLADELKDPVARLVKKHRELAKVKGTYVEGILTRQRGRLIHAGFHHTGTVTGRLSSSNPNLQNIPRKDGELNIRHAFIARPGRKFVISDYSQVELRLMAYYSACQKMVENYKIGGDLYKAVAAEIGTSRQDAKAVVLGLNYGRSAYGLSHGISKTVDECQKFIDEYFTKFPEVKQFMDRAVDAVRSRQQVRTFGGRLRRFPEYEKAEKLGDYKTMKRVERQATNAVIQGSAADVCKKAMIDLDRALKEAALDANILVQVHDELIVEVREDDVDKVLKLTKQAMESAANLGEVPLLVEPKITDRWVK